MRTPTPWDAAREARFIPRLHVTAWLVVALLGRILAGFQDAGMVHRILEITLLIILLAVVGHAADEDDLGLPPILFAAAGMVVVTALTIRFGVGAGGLLFTTAGVLGATGALAWWAWDRLLRPLSTQDQIVRDRDHSNHVQGAASIWDIMQTVSAWALRRRAAVMRPCLARLTPTELQRLSPNAYSTVVASTGWSLFGGLCSGSVDVRVAVEDVDARIGGPRTGKSGSLACHVEDAPGPVLCTSTRLDLWAATRDQRARLGRVIVFNPTGLGDVPSDFRWSTLLGCDDFSTAQRRAENMIPVRDGDAELWAGQGRRIFAIMLHAAARQGFRLQQVADWLADPAAAQNSVIEALAGAPNLYALATQIRQFCTTNDRTRSSIATTIAPALQWLANAGCAHAGDAPLDVAAQFDLAGFVQSGQAGRGADLDPRGDTLYLIGSEQRYASPLLSALTAEVAHQVRVFAARQPQGRLDPPCSLVLDELTLTCPEVPIDGWTSDMGGRGVKIHLSMQSLAQLRQAYGDAAAGTILNNIGTLAIFGGTKDHDDLDALQKLVGERLEVLDPDDRRYTAVMDGARISSLRLGQVLVLARGIRPVLGSPPMIWQRRRPNQPRPWRVRIPRQRQAPRNPGVVEGEIVEVVTT